MKILAHISPLGVGGRSITGQQLLEELLRRGHEVRVITNTRKFAGNKKSMEGHKLVSATTTLTVIENPLKVETYYKWADVVFTQAGPTTRAIKYAAAHKKPLITYIHDRTKIKAYGINRRNTALVIFNAKWLMDESRYNGNQTVVNPPVFPEKYRTERGDGILLVALLPQKGSDLFYKLARLMPEHHFIGLKGRGGIDIPRTLPSNVEIIDSVPPDRMKEVYGRARIVLMPSHEIKGSIWVESWGRVGIEAAASGIPTIASIESPGLRESLGEDGIFLPFNDLTTWESKIRELDDPEVYQRHSQYALKLSEMRHPGPQVDALEEKLREMARPKTIEPAPLPQLPKSFNGKLIDFYAGERHFIDHMAPIYHALPAIHRGEFVVKGKELIEHAKSLNIRAMNEAYYKLKRGERKGPLVVAAVGSTARTYGRSRPVVLVNHGAGQSWQGVRHSSYAGGLKRDCISLFIEPGDSPAAKDHKAYPKAKIAMVGCCKLDGWHEQLLRIGPKPRSSPPVIAISFHWECLVVPETRSTLPHYRKVLPRIAEWDKSGKVKILGHGHPNLNHWKEMVKIWESLGIEAVPDFDEVMERADVFVNDQMSTLYEFASLDRPVVVLNAPWYRRKVEHGLRFWECANVGIQVNEPQELIPAIREALLDKPEQKELRHKAVNKVYKYTDGKATDRAVEAILGLLK